MSATREKAESTQAELAAGTPPGRPGKPADTPRPRRLGLGLAVIAAAQLMVMLDRKICHLK